MFLHYSIRQCSGSRMWSNPTNQITVHPSCCNNMGCLSNIHMKSKFAVKTHKCSLVYWFRCVTSGISSSLFTLQTGSSRFKDPTEWQVSITKAVRDAGTGRWTDTHRGRVLRRRFCFLFSLQILFANNGSRLYFSTLSIKG